MPNPGPATTITPTLLLQANAPEGYALGTVSTTPIGAYGVSGVPQRSNANQLTVSAASASGTLLAVQTIALAPAAVGANTTLSQAFTATGSPIQSGDFLAVNALVTVSSAGGIGNVRAHTNTAGAVIMQFFNVGTAAGVTTVAASQFAFMSFRGMANSVALSPAAVPANSTSEQTFNVTGIAPGELAFVSKAAENVGLGIAGVRVAGNNLLAINFMNVSTAAVTPTAAEAYSFFSTNGVAANSNVMVYGVNVGTLTAVAGNATTNWVVITQTATCSSILASDILFGISKPTLQAQLGIVGQRITTANVVGIDFATGSVTGVTPTANEVYPCLMYRQAPLAPLTLLSVTCSPTAVGGLSTLDQTFSVTPVAAGSFVWVNKPTATSGLGIVNCRVSATGTVSITFANALVSTTISPPSEVYLFGVSQPYPSGGSNYSMQVGNGLINGADQGNELRNALAGIGFITGGTP